MLSPVRLVLLVCRKGIIAVGVTIKPSGSLVRGRMPSNLVARIITDHESKLVGSVIALSRLRAQAPLKAGVLTVFEEFGNLLG
jgi:hypothetical protein